MSIISKTTWDKFTQEEKEVIRDGYLSLAKINADTTCRHYEMLFGKENLHTQPLTYEDVARELFKGVFWYIDVGNDDCQISSQPKIHVDILYRNATLCTSHKQAEKLLAINKLLNVAAYLNKNEDGSPWNPDWENRDEKKWGIDLTDGEITVTHTLTYQTSIVYFRTEGLAQQAIQILGEDTVRLALTTEY